MGPGGPQCPDSLPKYSAARTQTKAGRLHWGRVPVDQARVARERSDRDDLIDWRALFRVMRLLFAQSPPPPLPAAQLV